MNSCFWEKTIKRSEMNTAGLLQRVFSFGFAFVMTAVFCTQAQASNLSADASQAGSTLGSAAHGFVVGAKNAGITLGHDAKKAGLEIGHAAERGGKAFWRAAKGGKH